MVKEKSESKEEFKSLRSQFGTTNERGGRRYPPLVFTEHGAIMAASILNTKQAIRSALSRETVVIAAVPGERR